MRHIISGYILDTKGFEFYHSLVTKNIIRNDFYDFSDAVDAMTNCEEFEKLLMQNDNWGSRLMWGSLNNTRGECYKVLMKQPKFAVCDSCSVVF